MKSDPIRMMVIYRPRPGKEQELRELVQAHWHALRQAGLAGPEPARAWLASDKRTGAAYFVEMFEWKDAEASAAAHRHPDVLRVWNEMEAVLDELQLAEIEPLEGMTR
jgi:hypothetical protein